MELMGRDPALRRVVLWIAISAAFTAMVIQFSYVHGKMLCPPFYDDVSYFEDALHRLSILYSYSVGAVLVDYVHAPPHSPFSTLLAATTFALMGVHDWAPYAGNGLVILGVVIFVNFLARDIPLSLRIALTFIVLCVPICALTVVEFRPDIPSALCTAMGATLLVTRSLTGSSWRLRVTAGALFGCGLLFKPPTCPLTAVVFAASLFVATCLDWMQSELNVRKLLVAWAQCIGSMVLVPFPHYLIDWRDIYRYIFQNTMGSSHATWARQGTFSWHLRYYFDGPAGELMIGGMLWPLVAIVILGLIVFIATGRRQDLIRLTGLVAVTLVSYAIPAAIDVKEPFFGTTFTWILVFSAVVVLSSLLHGGRYVPIGLLVLMCAIGLRAFRLGPNVYEPGNPMVRERNRLVNDIYAALLAQHFPHYARVYMTSTGYVNPGVFDYYYRRDTFHALNIDCIAFTDDLKVHRREMEMADFVVASETANGEAYADFVKSGLVQDQTLAIVRANPDFEQIASFPTLTGKSYFLFRRTNPFCGWTKSTGLTQSPPAKPATRPSTYFASGASTKIVIPTFIHPKLRFVARIAAPESPLHIQFSIDGRGTRQRILRNANQVEEITFPFSPRAGPEHTVEITYDPPADPLHPVVFSELEIIPDDMK